jgi:gliding motility-associated-like protein
MCTDSNGNVFVTGITNSPDFPLQNAGTFFQATLGGAGYDAFILKFDNAGNRLWASYFGSAGNEAFQTFCNLAADNCNNIYLSFQTDSTPFPYLISSSACSYFDNSYNGGVSVIIIARFTNNGSLTWCSYIGGDDTDFRSAIGIDFNNNLFIAGEWTGNTNPASYPLANPGSGAYYNNSFNGNDDGYIVKYSPAPLSYTISSVQASACGACDGSATFSITCGDAPYSYVWSNGQSVLNTTLTTSSISNLCDGVYNLTITAGCTQTLVETYTISGTGGIVAQANVLPGNTICAGQSLTLTTIAANTYTWSGPNNFTANTQNAVINNAQVTSSGVYTISIEAGPGCASTATVAVNVQAIAQPNVNFNYQTQYCTADGIAKVILSNGFNVGGIFSSNAGLIIDANTGDIDLSSSTAGTYIVTYNIAAGFCKAAGSNTAQVIINKSPVALIQSNAVPACPPLCASYSFVPTADVASYTWLVPSSSTIANTPTVQICYFSPGAYTMQLEVKGTNGCVAKGNYSRQVYPKPIADFVFNPINPTINEDDVVTFKDATSYGDPTQWTWYFLTETKNTITKFGNETTYKYTEAGTYPISLVVTNKYGCIDTVVKSIVVADDYGLFIPNAFTPNNDGINDTFVPKGHGIKSYTLVIFDRWGEQIYKTNHFENGWDGYYKGELSKSDVYTWKINCVDGKNKSHELVGSFMLIN